MAVRKCMYQLSLFCTLLCLNLAQAAPVTNSFVFIQNDIDNEYFITPRLLDPRFSGSNTVVKYAAKSQYSIGYMGQNYAAAVGSNLDIWLENIADLDGLSKPFLGNRCWVTAASCPKPYGYRPGQYQDHQGVYGIDIVNWDGEGGYIRGTLSESFYLFVRDWQAGTQKMLDYRYCYVGKNKAQANVKCKDLPKADRVIGDTQFNLTKDVHITLKPTNALQELWVDTNGQVSIKPGSKLCKAFENTTGTAIIKGKGVVCGMGVYDMDGSFGSGYASLDMRLRLDETQLIPESQVGAYDIVISGDGINWYSWSASTDVKNIFKAGSGEVLVFFKEPFFQKLMASHKDMLKTENAFTFVFNNTNTPQSGYYEFTTSNQIVISPKDYSISIVEKNMEAKPTREGNLGSDTPLIFDYLVTVNGPRNADEVTAQVKGDNASIDGQNYCLFYAPEKKFSVPFSAELSYVNESGALVKKRQACGDQAIYLRKENASSTENAQWIETAWPNPDSGYLYQTHLSLRFPLNETISQSTHLDKQPWEGKVSGEGTVEVKAMWRNVIP